MFSLEELQTALLRCKTVAELDHFRKVVLTLRDEISLLQLADLTGLAIMHQFVLSTKNTL